MATFAFFWKKKKKILGFFMLSTNFVENCVSVQVCQDIFMIVLQPESWNKIL